MVLRRLGALSVAKISGALYAVIGLIIGAIVALVSLVGFAAGAAASESGGPILGALFGVGAIVIFPIFYGILGFLGGLLMAALYNLLSGIIGGIELDLQ